MRGSTQVEAGVFSVRTKHCNLMFMSTAGSQLALPLWVRSDVEDQTWQSASDIDKAEAEPLALLTLKERSNADLKLLVSRLQCSCAVLLVLSVVSVCMTSPAWVLLYNMLEPNMCTESMLCMMLYVIAFPLKDIFAFLAAASILFSQFSSAAGIRGVAHSAQYAKFFATVASGLYSLLLIMGLDTFVLSAFLLHDDEESIVPPDAWLLYLLHLLLPLGYAMQVRYRSARLVSAAVGVGISCKCHTV